VRGHVRFKAGAWRLVVDAGRDPATGRRRTVNRTVRAPDTRAGRRLADSELAKLVAEAEAGRAVPASGLTVTGLLERYIRDREKAWTPGAGDDTRRRVNQHITPHVGPVAAERLRPVDVKQLHIKQREAGLSESTVARVHGILSAALEWAVDLELIPRNVARRRRPSVPRSKVKAPADDVMLRLLNVADGDMVCYLRLAAVTGARRGTLCALRWPDVDLDAGAIVFERALARVKGGVVEKGTKADVDYKVSLDARTVDIMRAHRRRAAERALSVGVSLRPDGFVFTRATTPDGSQPWHPDGVNQRFARIRRNVPGAETVTPHQFRHWMATAMFEAGYDPITVAGRGGWASPAVPLAIYGHRRPGRDEAAAVSLADRLDHG